MTRPLPVFRQKNQLIPGAAFVADPFTFTIRQAPLLGRFYRVPFVFRKLFVTSDPEVFSHVLQKNQKNYVKSVAYRHLRMAIGNGLVTSEGDYWRKQRRLVQPVFYKAALENLFLRMVTVADRFIGELRHKAAAGNPLEVTREMMAVTADITLQTLFSTENSADISELYRIMADAQDYIIFRTAKPHLTPLVFLDGRHRRFRRDIRWFDRYIYGMIDERKKMHTPPADLLTLLTQQVDADTGERMSDRQLRDEAITLYAAGHETSSTALSWTLYLLAENPDVLLRVRSEADSAFGNNPPSFAALQDLPYTRQVLQESMRLYPPAFALGRQPVADDRILGHPVPAGSIIFLSIAALHRDPAFWEKPDEFFPDHFLPATEKERDRMAYLPFGAGPRMCVGNHFAMMEMQLLLALLIRHFDLKIDPRHPVVPEPLITLKPKFGIRMSFLPRD
ncbi:MAG: hypothetical protein RLY31_2184 [Bacteroidota bacterium]|jgi:cytochrome P450